MSGLNGAPKRFRVDRASHIRDQIRRLFQEAGETDRAVEFATAMKQILSILRNEPREFGEPLWTYPHAHLEIRVGSRHPAWVRYAVHNEALEVVILHVALMATD